MAPLLVLALIFGHLVWRRWRTRALRQAQGGPARRFRAGSARHSAASPGPKAETTTTRLAKLGSGHDTNFTLYTPTVSLPTDGISTPTHDSKSAAA